MTNRLRSIGLVTSLVVAFMLALALLWTVRGTANAQSEPETKSASKKSGTVNIQLLGVNDFHGNLEPTTRRDQPEKMLGGAAYLDSYLDLYEKNNRKGTIRVHAGDMVNGSPLISSYFHDEPAVYAMNRMEFDVGTLGNHEFDEGGEEMLRLINGGHREDGLQFKDGVDTSNPNFPGAKFPYVSANVVYADSGETVLPPYQVVKRKGVKIGFIGVTTEETPNIVVPDAVAPFEFLDISETIDKYVPELQEKGVETIVILAHAGGFQTSAEEATGEIISETEEMNDAVDVVVAGHTHSELNLRVENKLIVEAFALGTAFDAIDLKIDRKTRDVTESSAQIVNTFNDAIQPDKETAKLVAKYKERITPIAERVVGTTAGDITRTPTTAGESALGDLIADAQRAFAKADFAFMNPGGIRADIQTGEVTYGELFSVQPFDNQVVSMKLTGEQIYRLLEQQFPPTQSPDRKTILQVSGLEYSYDESLPEGQRITSLTKSDGTPIPRDSTTYTVAVNSFLATGGDRFTVFKEGTEVQTLGGDLQALETYIEGLPQPFTAPNPATEQRITKQD